MIDPIPIDQFERQKRRHIELDEAADPRPPQYTDEALALRFAERHASDLRYVSPWGRWLFWDANRWRIDDSLLAFDHARTICRETSAECNEPRVASNIASAKTVAAVERLAKADRRLAATVDQWDVDIWALNTPQGVVDLRTGILRPHETTDFMTRRTMVSPAGEWENWYKFLDRITDGNETLQSFLQRIAGYCLTGATSAHALFFLFGMGSNGKSVFLDTLAGILGDYAKTAPIETFTASTGDKHPTDLAMLRGARLVTAVETEAGRRWAEARIKSLTGGDKVSARFMRQDFFEYTPNFKLIIAGNHKPGLRSVDEAIRRRFNLLPFTVTIPPDERDLTLKEKLKDEWPGILAWAVVGCLEWQRIGLAPPPTVTEATNAYLDAEDAVAAWLEDRCVPEPDCWERSTTLFSSWRAWADQSGEPAGTSKAFAAELEKRGFRSYRKNYGRGYFGFRLRESDVGRGS